MDAGTGASPDADEVFPIVAFASTVQFAPGEHSAFSRVESRMLLAGVSGAGDVEINQERVCVTPKTIIVMPWGHAVRYLPDPDDPYLVYGAHLIPANRLDHVVELAVPHDPTHPLAGANWRSDIPLRIGDGLWVTDEDAHPTLKTLLKLVAQVWDRGEPSVETARALGTLLVAELNNADRVLAQNDRRLPLRLRRALTWVMADMARPVSMTDISAVADCSPATVTRLFRKHLGRSPMAWVLATRLDAAKVLLTTTQLSVQQIAYRVGFEDSYHFSRRFHQHTGLAPTAWRQRWAAP